MSKGLKIGIIVAVAVGFLVLLFYFGGSKKQENYVTDDWTETYDPADKGPYGTYVLKELLDTVGLFGDFLEINTPLEESLDDEPGENDIYFFIGSSNYLDYESVEYLFEFILNGNTVFMSCDFFPRDFMYKITRDPDSTLLEPVVTDSQQIFSFTHPELAGQTYTTKHIYNNKTDERTWSYLYPENFDLYGEDTVFQLGNNQADKWNFVRIDYGDGSIFLHSTPYQFTNISMMKRNGFEYAENLLAHIPPGRIQWDRYNLNVHYWDESNEDSGSGGENRQSILQFFLKHPPLAWSIILLLVGAFLYAIFKGKRMQKVVPAQEAKDNTSLGYINTLASLYLQEKKHQKLIRLKERTFLNFIADHYYISTKDADDKFIQKVAVKSQIEPERIKDIFTTFRNLESRTEVSDDELINLHQKIEYFYKKCR